MSEPRRYEGVLTVFTESGAGVSSTVMPGFWVEAAAYDALAAKHATVLESENLLRMRGDALAARMKKAERLMRQTEGYMKGRNDFIAEKIDAFLAGSK